MKNTLSNEIEVSQDKLKATALIDAISKEIRRYENNSVEINQLVELVNGLKSDIG